MRRMLGVGSGLVGSSSDTIGGRPAARNSMARNVARPYAKLSIETEIRPSSRHADFILAQGAATSGHG